MNLQNVFPLFRPDNWLDMRELARTDWLETRVRDDADGPEVSFRPERVRDPGARLMLEAACDGAMSMYGGGMKAGLWLYAVSRLLAEGPKVFLATAEQCEAMEHVAVNIPLSDYRQAYPTVLVEYPREYLAAVDARTDADRGLAPKAPRFCVVRHWPEGMLFSGASVIDANGLPAELLYTFGGQKSLRSLESGLTDAERAPDPREAALVEMLTRVALNLMLLLSRATTRVVPSDPAEVGRARRQLKKGVKPDVQRRTLAEHVSLVVPDREIVVRVERRAAPAVPAGDRASPGTHWVRGHWRAHPGYGAARQRGETVPLLFVNPYLVVGPDGGPAPCPAYLLPGGA